MYTLKAMVIHKCLCQYKGITVIFWDAIVYFFMSNPLCGFVQESVHIEGFISNFFVTGKLCMKL